MPQRWIAFADHIDAVRRYARVVGRDAVHADDLVQECLARALARPGDWQEVEDTRAYLLTILHNLHVDEVERRWRDGVVLPIDDVDVTFACAPEQFGRLVVRDLARSLQTLPEERRRLLLLIALEGLSYRDVARLLDMPVGTVMSRLSRTRDALRRLMEEGELPNDSRRLARRHRGGRGTEWEGLNAAAAE